MENSIDSAAAAGFKKALAYDMHRPSYPHEVVTTLTELLPRKANRPFKIIDLAAGTGKFTELLADHMDQWDVIAVEPHKEMRQVLSEKYLKGPRVIDGMAENMEAVPEGWADAVVVAQAFHWFASIGALQEIRRVLAPGGLLFLLWNEEDYNTQDECQTTTAWESRMRDIAWTFNNKQRQFRNNSWLKVFSEDQISDENGKFNVQKFFEIPLQEKTIRWTVWLTKQSIWDRFSTLSFIASLADADRQRVQSQVFEIIENGDVEIKCDGDIAVHGRTNLFWTIIKPPT